ncbi:hypothetical protein Vretimale_18672 [Volvox reticuliferus]|uniref:Uncharacterized protein n=1 Tax=Volvox reticuliferus TaxID=1737510 RepID=A0A8J4LZS1_9CHLO|nr:hypothetical protein Vretifemale_17194 [Volvox reticuliferus]GIM16045.1 hypothetical protein Vretimale_18672 [Volvox reticuliferus]
MQSVTSFFSGSRNPFWPLPRAKQIHISVYPLSSCRSCDDRIGRRSRGSAPLQLCRLQSHTAWCAASEIIAQVLNEEHRRAEPASLLELLDLQGWGVATEITRKFSTKFASVTLEASWDDDPSGAGRVSSRRLAVLAVHQEWLVARSSLVGRLVDLMERLRPGYLPRELLDRVYASRSAAGLTPDSEALDGPALLLLAALLVPHEQLSALLDRVLMATREELLASPSYRGRPDLVPFLDRGLLLLRASAVRAVDMATFRVTHVKEALELEAELRRQQRTRQPRREEAASGVLGLWFRESKAASGASSGPAASARAANERLYAGQLAPEAHPWMNSEERDRAATAAAGQSGPRGLPGGRMGLASFRPLPGAALYSNPGLSGTGAFGSSDRLSFSRLDSSVTDLLAKADYEVPAAALSTFARLHRTALLDLLSSWQWRQLVGAEGDPAALRGGLGNAAGNVPGFYSPRCSHATSLKPAGPLQVARRTRIDVAPGPELDSLRALARGRSSQVLQVVHPLAWKQVVAKGEWEYWREAYRLWGRYAAMPPSCRSAALTLVLTPAQVPYVGLLEAEAAGRAAAASVAVPASAAADDLDMSSLTSMSSLDFDDAPLPAGITIPETAANATTASSNSNSAGSTSAGTQQGVSDASASKPASAVGRASVQMETTVQVFVPPEELRRFLLALLDLLPSHVGGGQAAGGPAAMAMAAAPPTSQPSQLLSPGVCSSDRGGPAFDAESHPWLPADATTLQVRYCPARSGSDAGMGAVEKLAGGGSAGSSVNSGTNPSTPAGTSGSFLIPEEAQLSCYELRWALGSATLTTAPAGPSASTTYSRINVPSRYGYAPPLWRGFDSGFVSPSTSAAVRWCAPMRLTQAQLMSLVNIFTDVAQQLPDMCGIQPEKLVVPTLSPVERLVSAVQGVAGSVVRVVGLLALLAVPLLAAIKAGGGDLNAMMRAAGPGGGGGGRLASSLAAAAAATVRSVQLPRRDVTAAPRAASTADATDAARSATLVPRHSGHDMNGRSAIAGPASGIPAAELAALCCRLEAAMEGRMWLEVSGTPAASTVTGVLPHWLETSGLLDPSREPGRQAAALASWPEFQLVVKRRIAQGDGDDMGLLGCKPVNAAARAVLAELPLSAILRDRAAERAVAEHLAGLTRTRIEQGKATPGQFGMPYQPARFQTLPRLADSLFVAPELQLQRHAGLEQQSVGHEAAAVIAEAASSASSTAPPLLTAPTSPPRPSVEEAEAETKAGREGTASGASVVVLKLELRPSLDPARHAVQRKAGRHQREFAQADVVVRPWYDSDSLLCWLEGGVQLPTLAAEMAGGLLAQEEPERTAFLLAYENLKGRALAAAPYGAERGVVRTVEDMSTSAASVFGAAGETVVGREPAAAAAAMSRGDMAGGVGGRSEGPVLKPQQLSEQQLQEAVQQLLSSLGVPESNVRTASSTGTGRPAAASTTVGRGQGGTASGG